jgi:hypothetical protein
MGEHEQWQLDGGAPELYERYIVPAVTALWAADLVEWAAPGPASGCWMSRAAPGSWRASRSSVWAPGG